MPDKVVYTTSAVNIGARDGGNSHTPDHSYEVKIAQNKKLK